MNSYRSRSLDRFGDQRLRAAGPLASSLSPHPDEVEVEDHDEVEDDGHELLLLLASLFAPSDAEAFAVAVAKARERAGGEAGRTCSRRSGRDKPELLSADSRQLRNVLESSIFLSVL